MLTAGGWLPLLCLAGCANPGPLQPPSAHLPELARALTAERTGGTVTLHWMAPRRSSDGAPLRGSTEVFVCREISIAGPCTVVAHSREMPANQRTGRSSGLTDTLPVESLAGPPRVLYYRVEERNAAGRSAGVSQPVAVIAGSAPPPVSGFSLAGSRDGVVLRWYPEPLAHETTLADAAVMVERTAPAAAGQPATTALTLEPEPAAKADAGGMIDTAAKPGVTYTYTARRVLRLRVPAPTKAGSGQTLSISSALSAPQSVTLAADYAPPAPTGLLAVAEFDQASGSTVAENLSWVPALSGGLRYNVYRNAGGTIIKLNSAPVNRAAYRDAALPAGIASWSYTVTAVDQSGLESRPTALVEVQH